MVRTSSSGLSYVKYIQALIQYNMSAVFVINDYNSTLHWCGLR